MIFLHFTIQNPFKIKWRFRHIDFVCVHFQLSKHKFLDIQISQWNEIFSLFQLHVDFRFNGADHAGPRITLDILNYMFSIGLHDNRHWDYMNDTWE